METNEKRKINKIDLCITIVLQSLTSSYFASVCDLKLTGEARLLSGGKRLGLSKLLIPGR